jgi:hypothetical protein
MQQARSSGGIPLALDARAHMAVALHIVAPLAAALPRSAGEPP